MREEHLFPPEVSAAGHQPDGRCWCRPYKVEDGVWEHREPAASTGLLSIIAITMLVLAMLGILFLWNLG